MASTRRRLDHVAALGLLASLAALATSACGDDGGGVDGGGDGAAPDAGAGLRAPEIPWLEAGEPPVEGPAPPAEPVAATSPPLCPTGEARFFGEAACAPFGSACPTGDFHAGLPSDAPVVHVRPLATGGDGSLSRPYGSVSEFSLGGLAAGSVVALARGTHDAVLRLRGGLEVWGACPAQTTVTTSSAGAEGVIEALGEGVVARDLRIADAARPGVTVTGPGRSIVLRGVEIAAVQVAGVRLDTMASLRAERVVIRDTAARASDGRFGRGLSAELGARVELERVALDGNRELGIYVSNPGTTLVADGLSVRDTEAQASDLLLGRGLAIQDGASASVARALLERNRSDGFYASGAGTSLALADTTILDMRSSASTLDQGSGVTAREGARVTLDRVHVAGSREAGLFLDTGGVVVGQDVRVERGLGTERDGSLGRGINLQLGAAIELTRVHVRDVAEHGVFAVDEGTRVVLRDAHVEATRPSATDAETGRGLDLEDGATAEIARAIVEGSREVAVHVEDPGTLLRAEDLVVRDTEASAGSGTAGRCVNAQVGGRVELRRALVARCRDAGLTADGPGAALDAEDLVVRDVTYGSPEAVTARGVNAQEGASVDGRRVVVERCAEVGVLALSRGTSLSLADALVRDSLGHPGTGELGRGVVVQSDATATLERVDVRDNREAGLLVTAGGAVEGHAVVVADTRARACAETTCADAHHGSGVVVTGSGQLTLSDFEIQRAALCGVLVARGGDVLFADGEVAQCTIGACVQDAAFDVRRLTDGVRYRDNGLNLEVTTLPLPDPLPPADSR